MSSQRHYSYTSLDCGQHQQKRDVSSQVYDIGSPEFNTVYEQLQNTVQLLSDKVRNYLFNAHPYYLPCR